MLKGKKEKKGCEKGKERENEKKGKKKEGEWRKTESRKKRRWSGMTELKKVLKKGDQGT